MSLIRVVYRGTDMGTSPSATPLKKMALLSRQPQLSTNPQGGTGPKSLPTSHGRVWSGPALGHVGLSLATGQRNEMTLSWWQKMLCRIQDVPQLWVLCATPQTGKGNADSTVAPSLQRGTNLLLTGFDAHPTGGRFDDYIRREVRALVEELLLLFG